jgi:phospholipid-binding lipoprotein MlaA
VAKKLKKFIFLLMMFFQLPCFADDASLLESYNKTMFKINDSLDQAVIKPVAKAYKATIPSPIQTGVKNFFGNLEDAWISVNQFLQGKPDEGMSDAGRFVINSTFGLLGIFDVASMDAIPKHTEDFGQTLGKWGVGEGGYFVIPILGPSTIRDGLALVVDWQADPITYVDNVPVRNSAYVVRGIDERKNLLKSTDSIDELAIDRYQAYKDAWLSHRRFEISDGASEVTPKQDDEKDIILDKEN